MIRSKQSGLYVSVYEWSGMGTSEIVQLSSVKEEARLWKFQSTLPLDRSIFIVTAINDKNLEIFGESKNDNALVVIGKSRKINRQIWKLMPNIDGSFK